jgi:hypothetical protein
MKLSNVVDIIGKRTTENILALHLQKKSVQKHYRIRFFVVFNLLRYFMKPWLATGKRVEGTVSLPHKSLQCFGDRVGGTMSLTLSLDK